MSTEASPRPWRAEPSGRVGTDCIFYANGVYVCLVAKCDTALIVDAVNEHGRIAADEARYRTDNVRLRDYARRLVDLVDNLLAFYEYRTRDHQPSKDFVMHQREFLAEVRKEIRRTKPSSAPAEPSAGKEGA